jgi:hypothetical protein
MVWGWFLASMFIFFVGLAMADLGSAMPTSGGLYWFVQLYQQSWIYVLTTQVDTLLLIAIDPQCLLVSCRLQQHTWSSRRTLLHRLRLFTHAFERTCLSNRWCLDSVPWRGLPRLRHLPRNTRQQLQQGDGQTTDCVCGHEFRADLRYNHCVAYRAL